MAMTGKPRFFFNNDATILSNYHTIPPISEDELIHGIVGRLVGTQVDVLTCNLFNFGDATPIYPTEVPEAQRIFLENFQWVGEWREQENIQWFLEHDPWGKVVQTAHDAGIQFWPSMRFNDIHERRWVSEFRANHPEWVLGDRCGSPEFRDSGRFCTGFNFAIPEVRAHRLKLVEEVCTRYDVDGFEWDFTRHPGVHFPDMQEALSRLTDYLREARNMLNRIGERRGRPVGFGVRTWQTLAVSRSLGLDVAAWIREGIVDYVSPAPCGGSATEPFFQEFLDLANATDCRIYACTSEQQDTRWRNRGWGPTPAPVFRAGALNAWRQGVDGIYAMNFCVPMMYDRAECMALLHEMGRPETVEFGDKRYTLNYTSPHIYGHACTLPLEFEVEPKGPGKTIHLTIGDDLEKAARLGVLDATTLELTVGEPGDEEVDFFLNDKRLSGKPRFGRSRTLPGARGNMKLLYDVRGEELIRQGRNDLTIIVRKRSPRLMNRFTVYDVSIAVRYRVVPARTRYR